MSETLIPLSPRAKLVALEQAGFTRADLARRLEVEYMTVYRWLAGKSEPHPLAGGRIDALYRERIALLPMVESLGEKQPDPLELLRSRIDLRERFLFATVYHSLALAGSRLTLAETRKALEEKPAAAAASPETGAAAGLRDALLQVLEHAGPGFAVDEAYLLGLHRLVVGKPGGYRKESDAPQGAKLVPLRVQAWLAHYNLRGGHPLEQAVRDYREFMGIHPFNDGNGRVGRLLLDAQLLSRGLPPALIRVDDQYDAWLGLRQGEAGDLKLLERLVCEAVLRAWRLLAGEDAAHES